jgi:hypothetical protein
MPEDPKYLVAERKLKKENITNLKILYIYILLIVLLCLVLILRKALSSFHRMNFIEILKSLVYYQNCMYVCMYVCTYE